MRIFVTGIMILSFGHSTELFALSDTPVLKILSGACDDTLAEHAQGSGVVVKHDGQLFILTSDHVVVQDAINTISSRSICHQALCDKSTCGEAIVENLTLNDAHIGWGLAKLSFANDSRIAKDMAEGAQLVEGTFEQKREFYTTAGFEYVKDMTKELLLKQGLKDDYKIQCLGFEAGHGLLFRIPELLVCGGMQEAGWSGAGLFDGARRLLGIYSGQSRLALNRKPGTFPQTVVAQDAMTAPSQRLGNLAPKSSTEWVELVIPSAKIIHWLNNSNDDHPVSDEDQSQSVNSFLNVRNLRWSYSHALRHQRALHIGDLTFIEDGVCDPLTEQGEIRGQEGAGITGQDGAGITGQEGAGITGQEGAGIKGQDGAGISGSSPNTVASDRKKCRIIVTRNLDELSQTQEWNAAFPASFAKAFSDLTDAVNSQGAQQINYLLDGSDIAYPVKRFTSLLGTLALGQHRVIAMPLNVELGEKDKSLIESVKTYLKAFTDESSPQALSKIEVLPSTVNGVDLADFNAQKAEVIDVMKHILNYLEAEDIEAHSLWAFSNKLNRLVKKKDRVFMNKLHHQRKKTAAELLLLSEQLNFICTKIYGVLVL